MKENKKVKELIFYAIITVVLVGFSILNNTYWKLGKETKQEEKTDNNMQTQLLEVNNITYNVPYEEEWLD